MHVQKWIGQDYEQCGMVSRIIKRVGYTTQCDVKKHVAAHFFGFSGETVYSNLSSSVKRFNSVTYRQIMVHKNVE